MQLPKVEARRASSPLLRCTSLPGLLCLQCLLGPPRGQTHGLGLQTPIPLLNFGQLLLLQWTATLTQAGSWGLDRDDEGNEERMSNELYLPWESRVSSSQIKLTYVIYHIFPFVLFVRKITVDLFTQPLDFLYFEYLLFSSCFPLKILVY